MNCVGGVEDEVESEGVGLVPVLLSGVDEPSERMSAQFEAASVDVCNSLLSSHLHCVGLLRRAVRHHIDLCAQCGRKHHSVMTETTNA